MLIQETRIDRTRNISYGSTDWYEPFTKDKGTLFKTLQKEYGRCTNRVYIDRHLPAPDDGTTGAYTTTTIPVGWVFCKNARYEDTKEVYLCETWVTLRDL